MKTFFLNFEVTPTIDNTECPLVKGAFASCWVRENDEQGAYAKATFYISRGNWDIKRLDIEPREVTERDYLEKDIGLDHFLKAQEEDISLFYSGWARDGKSNSTKIELNSYDNFNIGNYLKTQKKYANTARCLHYDSNIRCREIIKAHSIQKNRALSSIAANKHVYKLSTDINTLRKNSGSPIYNLCGINKASTFLGFCKVHDNELFEPIDNKPLLPTDQQVFLYAYRSLCREFFVKENSHMLFSNSEIGGTDSKAINDLLEGMDIGTSFGFKNLIQHKSTFDNSLRKKLFHEINYVLFRSKQKPTIVFSGLFYPDFDFMGRQLQNLANQNEDLALITFCSAPLEDGWGYLFAWHNNSDNICQEFMKSLATRMHEGENPGDLLFRLVISCCENHAISPIWWEKLDNEKIKKVTERISWMMSSFCAIKPSYLQEGLEDIVNWDFHSIESTMES